MKLTKLNKTILLSSLLFGGAVNLSFAQTADSVKRDRFIADEVIAVVGSSMILYSDLKMAEEMVEQAYIERGYTGENASAEAFESILAQKLLASYAAKDSLEVNNTQILTQTEQYITSLIQAKGSTSEVEKFFNRPIFSVREYIAKRIREGEMAKSMQSKVRQQVVMTPEDIVKFYKNVDKDSLMIIPEQYIYSQITRHAPKTDLAKLDVKEQLLNMRERIIKGASFQTMARMYSEDGTASKGGELEPTTADTYDAPFADALKRLKPGQISDIVESRYGFHLIQLISENNGLYHCRHILLRVKFKPEDLERAILLLDSVGQKVRADSLSFTLAVEQFSDDEESKQAKGITTNKYAEVMLGVRSKSTKFFKEDLGVEYEQIRFLKPKEVSRAYITKDEENNDVVKIIRLEEIIPSHVANLKEDYVLLEDLALKSKQDERFEKWLNEKIAEVYIKIDDRYKHIPLKNKLWYK